MFLATLLQSHEIETSCSNVPLDRQIMFIPAEFGIEYSHSFCCLTTHKKGDFFKGMPTQYGCIAILCFMSPGSTSPSRYGPSVTNPSCCSVGFPLRISLYILCVDTTLCFDPPYSSLPCDQPYRSFPIFYLSPHFPSLRPL